MSDKQPKIEKIQTPLPRVTGVLRHAFGHNLVNGFSAFLFAAAGPGAMILAVGSAANLPANQIAVWLFAGYSLSGVLTILVCYLYRQPLAFGYSMPALVIVGPALMHLSLAEMVGAYLVTGALILLLAMTGFIRKVTGALPEPIVMAMVAGVFLPYGLRMIEAFGTGVWIAGAMICGYLFSSVSPALQRRFPALLSALIAGTAAIVLTGHFNPSDDIGLRIVAPVLVRPDFSITAIIEFVIPLTITVVGIHNTQGFAILRNAGYRPPENLSTVICGGGTIVYGFLGCVPTVVTGPANAILNVSGDRAWRFVGGLWFGLFFILFGLFAPSALQIGLALPAAFIATLAGLAMIPVLQSAFIIGFGGKFSLSALVTFLTTVAGVSIYGIGAAFWGLVFGFAVALIVERPDFDARQPQK
ncbi:MAG: benzoate/H(+) symporter BenE family transporter [Pseudomonadota bacterium]|nr:benzoate/H(+) symporter BenE family transporter [Pseudomonadota bacterium]